MNGFYALNQLVTLLWGCQPGLAVPTGILRVRFCICNKIFGNHKKNVCVLYYYGV